MFEQLEMQHSKYSKDPLFSCALEGVSNVIAGIKHVSIVIHSPQGCASTVGAGFDQQEVDFTQRKIGCTRLFETDIVMGASDKLRDVIFQAEKNFHTELMFVVGTCASDIIGEDIDAVCREIQPKIKAKLVPLQAGGFRGNCYDGIDMGLEMLLPMIEKSPIKYTDSVNIIAPQASANPTWYADLAWVRQILGKIGLHVQTVFCHETSLQEIKQAGRASANILLSNDAGQQFAEKLEDEYGIPWIMKDIPMPIGLKNTKRWLKALGRYFHKDKQIENIIASEEKIVLDTLRKRGMMIIPRYRNCQVILSTDATMGIGLIRMLFEELEMIPEVIIFKHIASSSEAILDSELNDMHIHPKVLLNADGYAVKEAVQDNYCDLVIGSAWEKYIAEKEGLQVSFDVFEPTNRITYINESYFGFEGMLHLLQTFANDWERAFRSKNIEVNAY